MANRTDPLARSIHGTNPQNLIEKILRMKIYNSPDREIIVEFIKNEDYKYVRVLGAFYLRLVGKPLEVYQYLEPLYNDYRKLRTRNAEGHFGLSHMDELIDDMLKQEYLFDVALPRIPSRLTMERTQLLQPRISVLEDAFDEGALEEEAGNAAAQAAALEAQMAADAEAARRERMRTSSPVPGRRVRSPARERRRSQSRERDRDRNRDRRGRDEGRPRERSDRGRDERKRHRSMSPEDRRDSRKDRRK
ncbi:hypothetical protein WJX84_012164, partial [Apatococcus fuscideae]